MAQYTGFNMGATFASTAFTCLTSVDADLTADIYTAVCAGQTWKSRATGANDATFTINYMLDTSANELDTMQPGTTGTFTLSTNTSVGPQFEAASVVESHRISTPTEGYAVGTVVFGVDGSLTIT